MAVCSTCSNHWRVRYRGAWSQRPSLQQIWQRLHAAIQQHLVHVVVVQHIALHNAQSLGQADELVKRNALHTLQYIMIQQLQLPGLHAPVQSSAGMHDCEVLDIST
jgi:hypothetical protein